MITHKRALSLFSLAGLSMLLGVGVLSPAPSSAQIGTPRPGTFAQRGRREAHPELRRALRALMNAQNFLKKGAHDFAGHREKALDLTQQAISEVKEALASDKQ